MAFSDAQQAHRDYRGTKHFGSLDGLRCICIALVLWHHAPDIFPENYERAMVLTRGFTGVDFFFVLSGYLITTLLLREEDRYGRFSIAGFYRRRLLRIVPVYFLVVKLTAIWWIGIRGQNEWLAYLPYYYLFLANFLVGDIPLLAPMWSLSVEEQYYVLWPALLLLLPLLRLRVALVVPAIVLIYAADAALIPRWTIAETEIFQAAVPVVGYGAILIGSLTAILLHTRRGFSLAWRWLGHRWTSAGLLLLLVIAWQVLPGDLSGWPNLVMHLIMACIVASLVIREDHVLSGEDANLNWAKASVLEQEGKIDEAIAVYELLYEQNTSALVVANNLASLIATYRDDEESLERAWRIARRFSDADVPALQDTYGWIIFRRGEIEDSLPYLEGAAQGLPNDPIVQYHLGRAYQALSRPADALQQMQRAVEIAGPTDTRPQIEDARGLIVELQSQVDSAEEK